MAWEIIQAGNKEHTWEKRKEERPREPGLCWLWVIVETGLSYMDEASIQEKFPSSANHTCHKVLFVYIKFQMGLPRSLSCKKSSCDAGDPSLIPGLGRATGEGMDYPFQYSWASLVPQLVKSPPAMQETWIQSLGSDIP